ncbi:putative nucleotidyltransferase [Arcanobacterium wilhelmae]|uniref:Nucleotidyltransferase n=2 Tax=Arcanobacterium wilhelmae TaxID=1803177 RepID=A0ABT9NB51_9ACTO|nr:putative nucleotidyltransferase [Arcanobacterium wilhelmae]
MMVKPSVLLDLHREELRRVFKDSGFTDVAVFGSVARGMDTSESDIDFLISHDRAVGLFAIGNLSRKIENILAAPVDIVVNTGRQGPRLAKAQAEAVAL